MAEEFGVKDDYALAVQYIMALMKGDVDFALDIRGDVDDETVIKGLSLLSVFLFAELNSRYPNMSMEEFGQFITNQKLN